MKMNLMATLALLRTASIKLKFGRAGGYFVYFLNRLLNNPSSKITKEADLEKYLNDIHADIKSSSLSNNIIETPKVDLQIIIPVYNTSKFIRNCIDSVLTQDTKYKYHLVVVNDGSTDNSGDILSEYASDARVTILTQKNKGFSGARNTALQRIFSRYLTFLDSDDMLAPNAISSWLDAAYKYDADVVEGSFQRRTPDGKLFLGVKWNKEAIVENSKMQGFAWLKVYRADLWKNMIFPEGYWYEDTIICGLLSPMVRSYVQIPDYVYYYTVNKGSISFNSRGKVKTLDNVYITKSVLQDADKLGFIKSNYKYYYMFFLCQIHTNWDRTYLLGPDIEYAVFRESCDLFNKYFPTGIDTDMNPKTRISKALKTRNFNLYRKSNYLEF